MDKKKTAKRWSKEEISFLVENYKFYTTSELEKYLKRTHSSITKQASYLGLKKEKELIKKINSNNNRTKESVFSKVEIDFLKQNYKRYSNQELALRLDRSISSIAHKLSQMQCFRNKKHKNSDRIFDHG